MRLLHRVRQNDSGSICMDHYEFSDSPLAWFAALEAALRANDFRAAARARAELSRLGIEVRYRRLRPSLDLGPPLTGRTPTSDRGSAEGGRRG